LILAGLLGATAAAADPASPDAGSATVLRGLRLAAAGLCDEAIPLLAPAHAEETFDLRAAVADVRCRMHLGRHAEARVLLGPLRERRPDLAELDLYLAIAAYHTGDRDAAKEALARSRDELSSRVEANLYEGILAFEDGQDEAALSAFEAARKIDAQDAEPIASYYAAIANARLGRLEAAREDAQRVLASDPDGRWAPKAQILIKRLDERLRPLAWRLSASVGFEFDDNVVLRGEDVTLPSDISDEADQRLTWSLDGSREIVRSRLGTVGTSVDYVGTRHGELREFDVQYPAIALWWRRALGESSLAQAEYRFGYAWVGAKPFLDTHSFGVSFLRSFREAGRTGVHARGFAYRYQEEPDDVADGTGVAGDPCPDDPNGSPLLVCGPPGVDEGSRLARSGLGYELSLGHTLSPAWTDGVLELSAEARFQHYLAEGSDSQYLRLQPGLGARLKLPGAVLASVGASYTFRPFLGRSSLPDPDALEVVGDPPRGLQFEPTHQYRRDHIAQVSIGLERTFFDWITLDGRYTYIDNSSNQETADYDRHVVGTHLTVHFHDFTMHLGDSSVDSPD
jgi:tetratricopeptide (TPR) repeat protein